ncbi:Myosin-binding protein 3 [Camellia lanceoleosa]|uniref:Myosin-binding protein 3 n=1 Tax=Camellia lanceoleosa TaxID=1840588 RepID=A0ACC0HHN7_9ERIC|nr:Myosin-binding protein 3 [Camellia lanceoleosa]
MYGSPFALAHGQVWSSVEAKFQHFQRPFIIMGGLNQVWGWAEKLSSHRRLILGVSAFNDLIFRNRLVDLPSQGVWYTWCNNRKESDAVYKRLDQGARKLQNVVERDLILRNESVRVFDVVNSSVHVKKGRFDLKGKGIVNQRPRNGLRRRRKGLADYAKVSPVSFDPSYANDRSRSSINRKDDEDTPVVKNFGDRASHGFQLDETLHEQKLTEKSESSYDETKNNVQKELDYEGNEKNAIRILEQALEEEHAAHAALYLELEKEKSVATTTADEVMAMIMLLQDEKASIEMEAWQYQRIIEEKSLMMSRNEHP